VFRDITAVLRGDEGSLYNVVSGGPGCGKSWLIKQIVKLGEQCGNKVRVFAPTGTAAYNIDGETIHRGFSVPLVLETLHNRVRWKGRGITANTTYFDICVQKVKDMLLDGTRLIIFDEFSMISREMFETLDAICKKATDAPFTPFGGIAVALFGDVNQLPPVSSTRPDGSVTNSAHFCFLGEASTEAKPRFSDLWASMFLLGTEEDKFSRAPAPEAGNAFVIDFAASQDGEWPCDEDLPKKRKYKENEMDEGQCEEWLCDEDLPKQRKYKENEMDEGQCEEWPCEEGLPKQRKYKENEMDEGQCEEWLCDEDLPKKRKSKTHKMDEGSPKKRRYNYERGNVHILTQSVRHKDPELLGIIKQMPFCDSDETARMNVMRYIEKRIRETERQRKSMVAATPELIAQEEEGRVILCYENRTVNEINAANLKKIKGREYIFRAHDENLDPRKITEDNFKNVLRKKFVVESELRLKIGARVMILVNKEDIDVVNGMIGEVEKITKKGEVVVRVLNRDGTHRKVHIGSHKFEAHDAKGKVVVSRRQVPLKTAWACTTHKIQGGNIPKVEIRLDDFPTRFSLSTCGLFYVAFTRCSEGRNIAITGSIKESNLHVSPYATFFNKTYH